MRVAMRQGTVDVAPGDTTDCNPGWGRRSAVRNQSLMVAPFVIGAYAIARKRPARLFLFLPSVVALLTLWRRFVCARCVYYGRECSTMLGVLTAAMIPRDHSSSLDRKTMIVDFAYIGALWLFPLREVRLSRLISALYLSSLALLVVFILGDACPRCANDFCPLKDVSNRIKDRRLD